MAIVIRKQRQFVSYQVRVKDPNGQWYPSATCSSLEDAKAEELRLMRLKAKGGKRTAREAKRFTVSDYWEVWSVENRAGISKGWKVTQDQMYRDYVAPTLGDKLMADITAVSIGRCINASQKLGLGDQSRKHLYTLLRRMFGDAVEYYEMLAANPVKAKLHRPRVVHQERRFLVPAQSWRLLEASREHYLGPAIWIQLLAGLRPSEVQALRWQAVNLEQGEILICSAFNNKTRELQDYPKQREWGRAPICHPLATFLRPLVGKQVDLVCRGARGGLLKYETYLPGLKRLCKEAGVPQVTPHELRHSATELYVREGASQEDIRRLLNHRSLSSTARYMHRTDERLQGIAGRIQGKAVSHPGFPAGKNGHSTETEVPENVH